MPRLPAVRRAEERRVLDARVYCVWIIQGRLDVPDALELPGVWVAVIPLVRARRPIVHELVADRFPGLPAVTGALHQLAEPAAGLGDIEPVGVGGRSFHVIDLPAAEQGTADVPLLALAVGSEDERALPSADQHAHLAHTHRSAPGLHGAHDRGGNAPRVNHQAIGRPADCRWV